MHDAVAVPNELLPPPPPPPKYPVYMKPWYSYDQAGADPGWMGS